MASDTPYFLAIQGTEISGRDLRDRAGRILIAEDRHLFIPLAVKP